MSRRVEVFDGIMGDEIRGDEITGDEIVWHEIRLMVIFPMATYTNPNF